MRVCYECVEELESTETDDGTCFVHGGELEDWPEQLKLGDKIEFWDSYLLDME